MNVNIDHARLPKPRVKFVKRKIASVLSTSKNAIPLVMMFVNLFVEKFEEINKLVSRDLAGGLSLSISDHTPSLETMDLLDQFCKEIELFNFQTILGDLNSTILNLPVTKATKVKLAHLLKCWINSFLLQWDNSLEEMLLIEINQEHKKKCTITSGIFNFSNLRIPPRHKQILKKSKNTVLKLKEQTSVIRSRIIR